MLEIEGEGVGFFTKKYRRGNKKIYCAKNPTLFLSIVFILTAYFSSKSHKIETISISHVTYRDYRD